METSSDQRQQLIHKMMTRNTGNTVKASIQLWHLLALQLISIIGEGGFNALYTRSLYLTHTAFPWLPLGDAPGSADAQFTELKISFEEQEPSEAGNASHMLLLTFTDILASLVGEALTIGILRSAWGDDASESDIIDKELPHDQ